MDKQAQILKKYLTDLVFACEQTIASLDEEMAKPPSESRGKRIAKISNYLEISKDSAKHFGLGRKL